MCIDKGIDHAVEHNPKSRNQEEISFRRLPNRSNFLVDLITSNKKRHSRTNFRRGDQDAFELFSVVELTPAGQCNRPHHGLRRGLRLLLCHEHAYRVCLFTSSRRGTEQNRNQDQQSRFQTALEYLKCSPKGDKLSPQRAQRTLRVGEFVLVPTGSCREVNLCFQALKERKHKQNSRPLTAQTAKELPRKSTSAPTGRRPSNSPGPLRDARDKLQPWVPRDDEQKVPRKAH